MVVEMAGRLRLSLRGRTDDRDDRAIARATALFTFLLALKLCLLLWNILVKQKYPLADVPVDGIFYLVGADLLFCFGVALGSATLDHFSGLGGGWGRTAGRVPRARSTSAL